MDIKTVKLYHIEDFGGGLNQAVNAFQLKDNEWRELKNMQFDVLGSAGPRGGIRKYDEGGGDHLGAGRRFPIKGMHRHVRNDGTAELIIQGDQYVYNDNGTGAFADLTTITPGTDGFVRFAQWGDTLYLSSSQYPLVKSYHKGDSTEVVNVIRPWEFSWTDYIFWGYEAEGDLDTSKVYYYRFTLEYRRGGQTVAESEPISRTSGPRFGVTPDYYQWDTSEMSSWSNGGVRFVNFHSDFGGQGWDPTFPAVKLNIYRSIPYEPGDDGPDTTVNDPNFYYIGSIDVVDYNAAGNNGTVFTDDGKHLTTTQIKYNRTYPPGSRFIVNHKNRMWYVSQVSDPDNVPALAPYRVFYSDFLEPESVRYTSWIDVGKEDGEAITGAASWKNQFLTIWKPNSIWMVLGGDEELIDPANQANVTGILGDVELRMIDESVGCIAPQSIAYAEGGYIFLSNRGIEIFAGARAQPMESKKVQDTLNNMTDSLKSTACGIYDPFERKYRLAISDSTVDPSTNSVVLEYDFEARTWARHEYGPSGTAYGFNKFVTARRGDEAGMVLGAIDKSGLQQVSTGAVQVVGDVHYENLPSQDISYEGKTPFYDCGNPYVKKKFVGLMVKLKTGQAVTVKYSIDEGAEAAFSSSLGPSGHTWDESGLNWQGAAPGETTDHTWGAITSGQKWLPFPQTTFGYRVSLIFSGDSHLPNTLIEGAAIAYIPQQNVEFET